MLREALTAVRKVIRENETGSAHPASSRVRVAGTQEISSVAAARTVNRGQRSLTPASARNKSPLSFGVFFFRPRVFSDAPAD